MTRLSAAILAAALFATPALAEPVAYDFDKSHSNLGFSYNHLGYSTTEGRFGDWQAELLIDQEDPSKSRIDFTIEIDSLDTFFADRNKHLLSPDFFDAAKFPQATFVSTSVEKTGDNQLAVTGDLTIRGMTKPVTLDVTVTQIGAHPMANVPAVGFAAETTVRRSDFGMDMYVPYISDEVKITFHAEALQKQD